MCISTYNRNNMYKYSSQNYSPSFMITKKYILIDIYEQINSFNPQNTFFFINIYFFISEVDLICKAFVKYLNHNSQTVLFIFICIGFVLNDNFKKISMNIVKLLTKWQTK